MSHLVQASWFTDEDAKDTVITGHQANDFFFHLHSFLLSVTTSIFHYSSFLHYTGEESLPSCTVKNRSRFFSKSPLLLWLKDFIYTNKLILQIRITTLQHSRKYSKFKNELVLWSGSLKQDLPSQGQDARSRVFTAFFFFSVSVLKGKKFFPLFLYSFWLLFFLIPSTWLLESSLYSYSSGCKKRTVKLNLILWIWESGSCWVRNVHNTFTTLT